MVSAAPVAAKCNPGRGDNHVNGFAGWYRVPGGTVGGVLADIYDYSPWVNNGVGVSAWTMLNNGGQYAQIGWVEYLYNYRVTFVQFTHDGTYTENEYFGSAAGQTHRYTTLYNNIPGDFSFLYSGSLMEHDHATFVPNEAEMHGENQTAANQMPGAVQLHETFRNAQIWFNGAWNSYAGSRTIQPFGTPYYNVTSSSATSADIWDSACTGT
jgi:hypothetical protein